MQRQIQAKAPTTPSGGVPPRKRPRSVPAAGHQLAALQQSVGNRAVQRLIGSPFIQAKLQVSTPGDPSELEADRMADTVMRMPEPTAAQKPLPVTPVTAPRAQRACAQCEENEGQLQRKEQGEAAPASAPPVVHETLNSPGQPLDPDTRAFFEPRFGYDFSQVRTHTGAQAEASARSVGALAYTSGRDIVFGDRQYAPGTAAGRRLLAHELTHVVQQEGSGLHRAVLQRTPAPPTHGGVTAVRDLSRIRIDSVPDFVRSMFNPIRIVHPHVTDPSVRHISWEFYNPNDQMMPGSYSTLPGNPLSVTSPFVLNSTQFFGPSFVEGKYLLRCVGRNASHQPIVYADREFNVMSADLTTGTALPTTYGQLTFTRYSKTDANPPAAPAYFVDVELRFLPTAAVACNDVAFMQALQTNDSQGRSQQNTINAEHDARQTPQAWAIDRVVGAPSPFYISDRNPATGNVVDNPGWGRAGRGGTPPSDATLIDQPRWNQEDTARFESCVVCRSGAHRGQVYGCATWGYTASATGQVTLMPRSFRQMPSDQFEEARAAWNTWRTTQPAATRPEEAPALTRP